MARRTNPLKTLLAIAVVVCACLVGWTYYQTGEIGLWPKEVSNQRTRLRTLQKELRSNKKRIEEIQGQLAMGMRGVPRDELEQEIAGLEERNRYLEKQIARYNR